MLNSTMLARPEVPVAHGDLEESPLIAFYETTRACDLSCQHCRARAQTTPHPFELSPRRARQLVDQLADFPRPPALVLTGGDPLKRKDIYSLIEYGVHRRLEVAITPSATSLVTNEALQRLQSSGIARIAISLDGADAETHDRFRGTGGSYARTWNILEMAQTLGIPMQINTTLTPANMHQLDAIAEQLANTRIVLWSVFFLVPVGRAAGCRRLMDEQYEQVFAQLWRHSLNKPYRIKTTEAPHYRRFVLQQLRSRGWRGLKPGSMHRPLNRWAALGINDGKGILFISHVGLIYPSGFLPVVCGRFPADNVVRVYQHSPVFQTLRDPNQLQGKCGICEYRHVCGGSRARAYAVTGQLIAEEPDCIYRPAALE